MELICLRVYHTHIKYNYNNKLQGHKNRDLASLRSTI